MWTLLLVTTINAAPAPGVPVVDGVLPIGGQRIKREGPAGDPELVREPRDHQMHAVRRVPGPHQQPDARDRVTGPRHQDLAGRECRERDQARVRHRVLDGFPELKALGGTGPIEGTVHSLDNVGARNFHPPRIRGVGEGTLPVTVGEGLQPVPDRGRRGPHDPVRVLDPVPVGLGKQQAPLGVEFAAGAGLDKLAGFLESGAATKGFESLLNTAKTAVPIIQRGAEATFAIVKAAAGLFASLPPEIQSLAIAGLAINKLTGGIVTNIAGGLISSVLKQLVSGVVNVNGAVVNVIGAGGGVPGVGAAPAAAAGGLTAGAVATTAAAATPVRMRSRPGARRTDGFISASAAAIWASRRAAPAGGISRSAFASAGSSSSFSLTVDLRYLGSDDSRWGRGSPKAVLIVSVRGTNATELFQRVHRE